MNEIINWSLFLCFAVALQLSSAADIPCKRRDSSPGFCKIPRNCRQIADIMDEKKRSGRFTAAQTSYIRSSGSSDCSKGKLCCVYQEEEGLRQLLDQNCGRFSTVKVFGGHEVVLMSRPWLALLEFETSLGNRSFTCGGSLIHKRFVLTAAHCFKNNERLASVRLGEHQISTEPDCRTVKGRRVCAPHVEDIEVEDSFIHEQFAGRYNDIAIVKLARDVEFQQNIKPICLPVNATLQQAAGEINTFTVTGWGRTENETFSDVLLETQITQQVPGICHAAYRMEIKSTQLCVGDQRKDSCNGDSGGPLSYVSYYNETQRIVLYGVVSFGSRQCAQGDPGVYTNVGSFMLWIADKIATK